MLIVSDEQIPMAAPNAAGARLEYRGRVGETRLGKPRGCLGRNIPTERVLLPAENLQRLCNAKSSLSRVRGPNN